MLMLMLTHMQVSQHARISRQAAWDWMHYIQQVASTTLGLSSMLQRMIEIQVLNTTFADPAFWIQVLSIPGPRFRESKSELQ